MRLVLLISLMAILGCKARGKQQSQVMEGQESNPVEVNSPWVEETKGQLVALRNGTMTLKEHAEKIAKQPSADSLRAALPTIRAFVDQFRPVIERFAQRLAERKIPTVDPIKDPKKFPVSPERFVAIIGQLTEIANKKIMNFHDELAALSTCVAQNRSDCKPEAVIGIIMVYQSTTDAEGNEVRKITGGVVFEMNEIIKEISLWLTTVPVGPQADDHTWPDPVSGLWWKEGGKAPANQAPALCSALGTGWRQPYGAELAAARDRFKQTNLFQISGWVRIAPDRDNNDEYHVNENKYGKYPNDSDLVLCVLAPVEMAGTWKDETTGMVWRYSGNMTRDESLNACKVPWILPGAAQASSVGVRLKQNPIFVLGGDWIRIQPSGDNDEYSLQEKKMGKYPNDRDPVICLMYPDERAGTLIHQPSRTMWRVGGAASQADALNKCAAVFGAGWRLPNMAQVRAAADGLRDSGKIFADLGWIRVVPEGGSDEFNVKEMKGGSYPNDVDTVVCVKTF